MALPRIFIDTPARKRQLGGLLAVANVIKLDDPHVGNGVQYISDGCDMPSFAPGLCDPQFPVTATQKTFTGINFIDTPPFGLYTGIECGLDDTDSYQSRAEATLLAGETYGVELGLLVGTFQTGAATVIDGSFDLISGVAELEQQLGATYPGLGMIHMSRRAATIAAQKGSVGADKNFVFSTKQGTPVANGAGYVGNGPGDIAPALGSEWIYATGGVNITAGPIIKSRANGIMENRSRALAERVYSVTVECVVLALQVALS